MNEPEKYSYLFGPFRLSVAGAKLYFNDSSQSLSLTQFKTLLMLIENRGEPVNKNALRDFVHGSAKADVNIIDKAIHDLRGILHDSVEESKIIKTVWGKGYCFVADVRKVREQDLDEKPLEKTSLSDMKFEIEQPVGEYAPAGEGAVDAVGGEVVQATRPVAESDGAVIVNDGMSTFEEWRSGPGKTVTMVLYGCVILTCTVSIPLSVPQDNSAKIFATTAQFFVVLILYIHFWRLSVPEEFGPITGGSKEDFKKIIGCDDEQECIKTLEVANSALKRYTKYWRGLLLSWFSLYLYLTYVGFTGIDLSKLDLEQDTAKQNFGIGLSIVSTLFNNWNTLMIFLCFYVLNKQIRDDEESPNILDRLLTGPYLLLAVTAFEISLILPIDKTAISKVASLVSGLAGGVAMALYVGRLQSKFIGPHLWVLIALYSYTAIQPLFLYLDEDTWKSVLLINVALILKCLLYLYMAWLLQSGRLLFYLVRVHSAYQRVNMEWRIFRRFLKQ